MPRRARFEDTKWTFPSLLSFVSVDVLIELVSDVKLNCHAFESNGFQCFFVRLFSGTRSSERLRRYHRSGEVIISHNASRFGFI